MDDRATPTPAAPAAPVLHYAAPPTRVANPLLPAEFRHGWRAARGIGAIALGFLSVPGFVSGDPAVGWAFAVPGVLLGIWSLLPDRAPYVTMTDAGVAVRRGRRLRSVAWDRVIAAERNFAGVRLFPRGGRPPVRISFWTMRYADIAALLAILRDYVPAEPTRGPASTRRS